MHLLRFFTRIVSCLSVARAFNVTVRTPTQREPLSTSLHVRAGTNVLHSVNGSSSNQGGGSAVTGQTGQDVVTPESSNQGGDSVALQSTALPYSSTNQSTVSPQSTALPYPNQSPVYPLSSLSTPSTPVTVTATATDIVTTSPSSSSSSSSSSPSSSSSSNHVAVIAGAAGGGGAVLVALVILGTCLRRKWKASRLLDVQSSTKSHRHQLQRDTDLNYESSPHPPQSPSPYKTNTLSNRTRPIHPTLGTQSEMINSSTGTFVVSAPPPSSNQTQHSPQSSNTDSSPYGDTRSLTVSFANNRQSPPSTRNFTPNDPPTPLNQTQPSHMSPKTELAVYGDAQMSGTTPAEYMAAGARPASSLPRKTDPVYLAPPVQVGIQSTSASAGNVAGDNPPTPSNQAQNSRQSPSTDILDVHVSSGSQSMSSANAQTTYRLPTRIIVHIDANDVMPDENGVVELPPQYSEHWEMRAHQSEPGS